MGASRIKGITIEIGGDTTKLTSALKKTSTEIRSTQAQLKDVNKLLKLDPSNTVLLTQKQKLLKDAIAETKEKLKTLNDAQKQAKEQLANGDIGQEEYDALEREIVETEQSLKSLEKEYKNFGSVGSQQAQVVAEKFKEVGSAISEVGTSITKNVTTPLLAVSAAAVKSYNSVDDAMDIIREKTGATGDDLAGMQQSFENLVNSMPVDMETVGNAIGEVSTRFGTTGEELETLSQAFVEFAELNETDVTNSIDTVQNAMAAFGMKTKDAKKLLDVMNKTGQNTGVSMETLQSGLVENAEAFQQMGMNAYEATAFMGKLATAGADSTSVMSGLKRALKSATEEGVPFSDALKEMEDAIKNGTDDMDGLTYAYDLFGKSGAGVYAAVKNGSLSFEDLAQSSDILTDSLNSVANTYDSVTDDGDEFKIATNNLQTAMSDLGSTISTSLVPMLNSLSTAIQNVSSWYGSLTDAQQVLIVKLGAFAIAIGPIVTAVGKLCTAIGNVISWFAKAMPYIKWVASGLSGIAGPAALVIALFAELGAGVAIVIDKWDDMERNWNTEWQQLVAGWNSLKDGVSNVVSTISGLADTLINKLSTLASQFTTKFQTMKQKVTEFVNAVKNPFKNLNWSLPNIKLPHFRISPAGWKASDLLKGTIPTLSISWYKKAMDNAMVLDGATIFGSANGQLLGGGEAGREVVSGESHLVSLINASMDSTVGSRVDALYSLLATYLPAGTTMYMDGNVVAQSVTASQNKTTKINNMIRGTV